MGNRDGKKGGGRAGEVLTGGEGEADFLARLRSNLRSPEVRIRVILRMSVKVEVLVLWALP